MTVLDIVFRSFWTWAGTLVLLIYGLAIISNGLVALARVLLARQNSLTPEQAHDLTCELRAVRQALRGNGSGGPA